MRLRCALVVLVCSVLTPGEDLVKPEKLSIHTWVREDLFAGWMARDDTAFENGVRKLERYLQDRPNDKNALAWKHLVETYRMRQAGEKQDKQGYDRSVAAAKALRQNIFSEETRDPGPWIIVGSSLIAGALWAREDDKVHMYRDGRQILSRVPVLQGEAFDKLPPHMRGELWSQLAFASDRLGEREERDRIINLMLTRLQGSPYERRAQRWLKADALRSEADNMCISCHEPGRLKPTLERLSAAKAN